MKNLKNTMMVFFALAVSSVYSQNNSDTKIFSEGRAIDEIGIIAELNVDIYKADNSKKSKVEVRSRKGDLSMFEFDTFGGEFEIKYTEEYKDRLNDMSSTRRARVLREMKDDVSVKIYTTDFSSLRAALNSNVCVKDDFDYEDLTLKASTSGKIFFSDSSLDIQGELTLTASTSGRLIIESVEVEEDLTFKASTSGSIKALGVGSGGNVSMTSSTSGRMSISDLAVKNDVKTKASTSGVVLIGNINIESGLFSGQSSTSGKIKIESGKVLNKDSQNSFISSTSGNVNCKGVEMYNAEVSSSTGGSIYVNVSNDLDINKISTGGDVNYVKKTPMFSITGAGVRGLSAID